MAGTSVTLIRLWAFPQLWQVSSSPLWSPTLFGSFRMCVIKAHLTWSNEMWKKKREVQQTCLLFQKKDLFLWGSRWGRGFKAGMWNFRLRALLNKGKKIFQIKTKCCKLLPASRLPYLLVFKQCPLPCLLDTLKGCFRNTSPVGHKENVFVVTKHQETLNKPHLSSSFISTLIAWLFISTLKTISAFYFSTDRAHNELF